MYSDFFGFDQEPFNVTPDSDFVYYSEQHKEALAHMLYGVQERKGFIVVTGRVGSGKTTLCRAFMNELDDDTSTALVLNSKMTAREILEAIVDDFGVEIPDDPTTKDIIDELNQFVLEEYEQGRNVCVIIDESQNLSPEALENLRLLSNLETEKEKLLQMVLVGQPELNSLLNKKELRQLKQRIAVRAYLSNLTDEETREYVNHRIESANPRRPLEIRDEVYERLHEMSGGNPRAINLIMDHTLLAAYVDDSFVVSRDHVDRALEELSEEVIEQEGKDARVLHRIRHEDDAVTIRIPEWLGTYVSGVSEHWMYGAAAALLTMVVLLGGFWINGNKNGNTPVNDPVISERLGGSIDTDPMPDTTAGDLTEDTGPVIADTESTTEEVQAETPTTAESADRPDTEPTTEVAEGDSAEGTTGETLTESTVTGGTTGSPSGEGGETAQPILARALDNNPPLQDLPNPLDVVTADNPEPGTNYGIHALTRYISLKLESPTNIPTSLPDPPLSEINGSLTLDDVVPEPLPGTFVRVPSGSSVPVTYGFPTFLEWEDRGTTRTVLLLPYRAQIWDPVEGWLEATEDRLNEHWTGRGRFLVHSPVDPNTTYNRGEVSQAITEIQRMLNDVQDAGLPLVGRYGPRTTENIRRFQREHGLRVDGVAGPETILTLLREARHTNTWSPDQYAQYIRTVEADVVLD